MNLLAHVTTKHPRNKVPHSTERILVGKFAVMIVILKRIKVAPMIIHKPFEDRRFVVKREITDLDNEHDTRETVCVKLYALLLEMIDTRRDPVVRDLRVVERDASVLIEHVEAKLEV